MSWSPRRRISTSSLFRWNSLGILTAWLLPLLNTLAVFIGASGIYTSIYTARDGVERISPRATPAACRAPSGRSRGRSASADRHLLKRDGRERKRLRDALAAQKGRQHPADGGRAEDVEL